MKLKSLLLIATLFVFSTLALSQNFTNNYFSSTFVAPVTFTQTTQPTSIQYEYAAGTNRVGQSVDIRLVDHDIPYGFAATEWYANADFAKMSTDFPGASLLSRNIGTYQGHPFTEIRVRYNKGAFVFIERVRYIYIGAREIYFVNEVASVSYDDSVEWSALVNMNIVR